MQQFNAIVMSQLRWGSDSEIAARYHEAGQREAAIKNAEHRPPS